MSRLFILATLFFAFFSAIASGKSKSKFAANSYSAYILNTETYSAVHGLQVDIYQPADDSSAARPLIILAHGGGFVGGTKNNPVMERMAIDFAKRGFVAASINYRKAENMYAMFDTTAATRVVVQAIADGRAAVRYFRKSFAENNPWRIDTSRIVILGNSAGGIVAAHVGMYSEADVVTDFTQKIVDQTGGWQGDGGHPGFSSTVSAAVVMAGAIKSTQMIDANDAPVICFHGKNDQVVPYNCGGVYEKMGGYFKTISVCGGAPIYKKAQAVGLSSELHDYDAEHMPWKVEHTQDENELLTKIEQQIVSFLLSVWPASHP